MPSLAQQLGHEYVDQFYRSSMFQWNGKVFVYGRHVSQELLKVHRLNEAGNNWEPENIPSEAIADMDVFAWPKLGYRQYNPSRDFLCASYITMQRSAMRGLKDELLNFDIVGDCNLLPNVVNMRDAVGGARVAKEIFKPSFTPFNEGIDLIAQGKAFSFALNEDLAIALSCTQGPDRFADVLYKQRVIGEVRPNGEVVVLHKIAKKPSSQTLFGGKLRV